jgi:hypothetical protein
MGSVPDILYFSVFVGFVVFVALDFRFPIAIVVVALTCSVLFSIKVEPKVMIAGGSFVFLVIGIAACALGEYRDRLLGGYSLGMLCFSFLPWAMGFLTGKPVRNADVLLLSLMKCFGLGVAFVYWPYEQVKEAEYGQLLENGQGGDDSDDFMIEEDEDE